MNNEQFTDLSCTCKRSHLLTYYWYPNQNNRPHMCGHALAIWQTVRERIIRENPGDSTDYAASQLLSILAGDLGPESVLEEQSVTRKKAVITLCPRIVRSKASDDLKLTFDISREGVRSYALKSLESLVKAVENQASLSVGKSLTIYFSQETFTEESEKWYRLITSHIRSVSNVNSRLRSGYYSYGALSAGNGIPLEESDLDIIYDMTEGGTLQFQYDGRSSVTMVRVGEARPRAELTLTPVKMGSSLAGIRLSGRIPHFLRGSRYQYVLDHECFGRVNPEELKLLQPFRAIESGDGEFSCVIGEKKFAEFWYRVLPRLQEAEEIILVDQVSDLMEQVLPPEPSFTFYLDLDERLTCRPTVKYDAQALPLGFAHSAPVRQDRDQEQRVLDLVRIFFPHADQEKQVFWAEKSADALAGVKTEGVTALAQFGQVMGRKKKKKITVGLLDLTIQTKDMSEGELLDLLASYRLKKRWHQLKNGDFIDLKNAESLQELDETAQSMDLSLEELVRGGAKMPKYRALYVDKMLETHDEIAASRDRQFKALVRSFQTIRDSDFEVSEGLGDVLRPYQLYGYRWLCTLGQYGFGGILADEMGLGKTLQMLSYIESRREAGENRPALVVCPASLVYNWKEECRRFTPALPAETVAGTLSQRKAQIKKIAGSAGLFITSYDLLKRDITLYDSLDFSTVVLDEAQYIKNQKAAVSKAVRVLKADHRFALTGTPIENRLSELWSIFDFLMPGFLYTAAEFSRRFETPIMKGKDQQAAVQLSRMTEPFILRRKKTDVLRDLPEKLEETRSAAMEEDQRKLYDAQVVRMKALLDASGDSGEDKMRILAEITRLRQLCCDPSLLFDDYKGSSAKRAACLELIQNAMDAGHRMLVFSQFTSMLSLLEADLKQAGIAYFTITGSTPKQERLRLVNAFNNGGIPVFLISLKAGGTGLNLTGADVVIHYDPWWNLAVQNQATDRAHRIGQTRQVTVIKLIAAETIEERIVKLQETKRDLAEAIIGEQTNSLMSLSREELLALIG